MEEYIVQIANETHVSLAEEICHEMEESAKARGTGIAKRSPQYLVDKMREGKAVVATDAAGNFVGFCYVETWGHGAFVANSGLIVNPRYRKSGIAKRIKEKAFELSRQKYPAAKIFGLTTSLPVMKINSSLGYKPVTFSELTSDETFWKGCASCVNYDILTRTERKHCLCTGMLFDPAEAADQEQEKKQTRATEQDFDQNAKLYERWLRFKARILTRLRQRTATPREENVPLLKLIGDLLAPARRKQSA